MWSDAARRRNQACREHAPAAGPACDADAASLRLVRGCHNDRACENQVQEIRDYWSHLQQDNERHHRGHRVEFGHRDCVERGDDRREGRPSYAG
ncbi:MAG: hypothetical protein KDA21_14320, partial [Phycisphaerales bacterium]|nr:hypothetical protein [Phycisphaerales bacterium]